jgi:hypothetical protein
MAANAENTWEYQHSGSLTPLFSFILQMCLRIPRSWCAPCCCVALTVNALTKSTHTWTRQAQDVAPLASDHRVCKSSVGNLGIMVAGRYLVHNTLIYICTNYIGLHCPHTSESQSWKLPQSWYWRTCLQLTWNFARCYLKPSVQEDIVNLGAVMLSFSD